MENKNFLKNSTNPKQSAYLYSSSHLFNQQRIQAQKAYAKKQQERLRNFEDEFQLDISESMSAQEHTDNHRIHVSPQEQYQIAPITQKQGSQLQQLLLSQQNQVDGMFNELVSLKSVLKNCQQSHRAIKKSELSNDDKQFLKQMLDQYGPPKNGQRLQDIKYTLSKILEKINLPQQQINKQVPKKQDHMKMPSDASLIYDGKSEQDGQQIQNLQNMNKSRIPQSKCMCSISAGINNSGAQQVYPQFSIKPIKVSITPQLQNYISPNLNSSKNMCSIRLQPQNMINQKQKDRSKLRYNSQYESEELIKRPNRSQSEKNKKFKQINESNRNNKQVRSPSGKPSKQKPIKGINYNDRDKLKTQRHRYDQYKNTRNPNKQQIRQFKQQYNSSCSNSRSLVRIKSQKTQQFTKQIGNIRHLQPSEQTESNNNFRNKIMSNIVDDSQYNSPIFRLNIQQNSQKFPEKMQICQVGNTSFQVELNRIKMQIQYKLIYRIKFMKNMVEIQSRQIGNLLLVFDRLEDYHKFYQRVLLTANRN